jgi:hypothetical protein
MESRIQLCGRSRLTDRDLTQSSEINAEWSAVTKESREGVEGVGCAGREGPD